MLNLTCQLDNSIACINDKISWINYFNSFLGFYVWGKSSMKVRMPLFDEMNLRAALSLRNLQEKQIIFNNQNHAIMCGPIKVKIVVTILLH